MRVRFLPSLIAALNLLAALSGCSGTAPNVGTDESGGRTWVGMAPEEVTEFLQQVLVEQQALGYEEIVARFGAPVRTRAVAAEGMAGVDTLRMLAYHGLEVTLYEGAAPPAQVAQLALTDARYTSPEGLRVGHAQNYVVETLGRPTRETNTRYFFKQPGPPLRTLVVTFERRAVSRIEWNLEYE